MVHGDDFIAVGLEADVAIVRKSLEEKYKIKVDVVGGDKDDKREVRILNRVIRYCSDGIRLEADPRHAELVVRELGLDNAKSSKTPGSKIEQKRAQAHVPEDRMGKSSELDVDYVDCIGEIKVIEHVGVEGDDMCNKCGKPDFAHDPACDGHHDSDDDSDIYIDDDDDDDDIDEADG